MFSPNAQREMAVFVPRQSSALTSYRGKSEAHGMVCGPRADALTCPSLSSRFIFPTTRLGAESQFSDFLDGLGPAQIVGRQTLATPPMGEFSRWGRTEGASGPTHNIKLSWERGEGICWAQAAGGAPLLGFMPPGN